MGGTSDQYLIEGIVRVTKRCSCEADVYSKSVRNDFIVK